ncbi:MAG: carbon monoxide dehydrogenase [Alphaproteobacteria bacterium]|nr:SRPBCC family protein [Pseudomonadota bacterium]TDI66088.1 MAG: carbon monoxide dehydrogenase [Alphaproteobacteria bacterium]
MKLENAFEVALPPPEAWALLLDIERIAPCLPGASITEVVDEKNYKGQVALRLGPVALNFVGKVTFVEIDDSGRRARLKAQGTDAKGRGGANAEVEFRIVGAGDGAKVIIETDLNLFGSIAQYGRGVGIIQATAEQLIGEFADNLARQLAQPSPAAAPAPGGAAPQAKPISGFRLMFRVLWNAVRRFFGGGG